MERELINESLVQKWSPLLENDSVEPITDSYKRACTVRLLENTERELREQSNTTGNTDNTDPILMGLVRRAAPNLIHYDIGGVQPMTGPTGLIFAMRAHYGVAPKGPYGSPGDAREGFRQGGTQRDAWATNGKAPNEALFDEARAGYSGAGTASPDDGTAYEDDFATYSTGSGMGRTAGEYLGRGEEGDGDFAEMSFTIEKTSVEAKTRALKAEYTMELQQDLRAVHGLDAENELANILSSEIISEQNREFIKVIRRVAHIAPGEVVYLNGVPQTDENGEVKIGKAGLYDLDYNSDGRWSAEKYKSLLVKINKEANAIAKRTRRGRGNILIVSSNVAAVLDLSGKLDYAPAVNNNLHADDTGPTFIGVLQGRFRVYIDPYLQYDEIIVGYKGSNQYDAGVFFAPYVPLTMVRAMGENTFQPKLAFKTRYGLVANPFTTLETNKNSYYTKFKVTGI